MTLEPTDSLALETLVNPGHDIVWHHVFLNWGIRASDRFAATGIGQLIESDFALVFPAAC
jgi:hypothetical protein